MRASLFARCVRAGILGATPNGRNARVSSPQLPAGVPVCVIVLDSVRFACHDLGITDDLPAAVTTGGRAGFGAMSAWLVCVLCKVVWVVSA